VSKGRRVRGERKFEWGEGKRVFVRIDDSRAYEGQCIKRRRWEIEIATNNGRKR